MNKKKVGYESAKDEKAPNNSVFNAGMVSPRSDLVERAELNELTSAKLYKVLQYKNVCGRSKLSKKADRINALHGITTHEDLRSLGFLLANERTKETPNRKSITSSARNSEERCKMGRRFDVPVSGIDVHKDTLVVSVVDSNGTKERRDFSNDEKGIDDLIRFYGHHTVNHCALESTAEYWLKVFWQLTERGIYVLVANPLQMKTTQGKKTDKFDADRIAIAFRDGRLKPSVVCTPDQYSMRKLSRSAFKKMQQATSATNRLKAMLETYDAVDWIKTLHESKRGMRILYQALPVTDQEKILEILTEEYGKGPHQIRSKPRLQQRAKDLTRFLKNMDISPNNRSIFGHHLEDYLNYKRVAAEFRLALLKFGTEHGQFTARFKRNMELLLTVPNVDINTALTMLVEITDINFFWNSKALVRWAGLAPSVKQSGYNKRKNGHIYKGGNKWLRTAAWLAARNCYSNLENSDEPIGTYIQRLFKERNKHYFVAVTAGARKMVTYIYHVLKQQRPFDEVFEMDCVERLKANQKRKMRKLRRTITGTPIPDLLPIIANSLKREQYKLSKVQKGLAQEIATKLGVAPQIYVDGEFPAG